MCFTTTAVAPMTVSPPDEALRVVLLELRAQNPSLGISKLQTKLLTQHPEWAVSEKRVKKIIAQNERPVPPLRPTSRIIENLNVSRWTNKVKVVDYGSTKGKGLVATAEIKVGVGVSSRFFRVPGQQQLIICGVVLQEGEDVWKEDPFVISPSW